VVEEMNSINLGSAYRIVDAGIAEARKLKVAACIAVVDAWGYPVMTVRMDGALFITAQLAEDKAFTAAAVQMATHDLQESIQPARELYGLVPGAAGRLVPLPGGLPLRLDGAVVGGVGVSGGSTQEDLKIAEAVAQGLAEGARAGLA
jgi:uncharacterized protein GlcG (DUF336 family)